METPSLAEFIASVRKSKGLTQKMSPIRSVTLRKPSANSKQAKMKSPSMFCRPLATF